jgi:hypothetical protein
MKTLVMVEIMIQIGLCGSGTSGTTNKHSKTQRGTPIAKPTASAIKIGRRDFMSVAETR